MIDDISEFDEWPSYPKEGTYWKDDKGEPYRVEHIYFEDHEVALTELSSGEEIYTILDHFDHNYEEIEESEIPLYLLANAGVAYG